LTAFTYSTSHRMNDVDEYDRGRQLMMLERSGSARMWSAPSAPASC
jgi:hypothetical protein